MVIDDCLLDFEFFFDLDLDLREAREKRGHGQVKMLVHYPSAREGKKERRGKLARYPTTLVYHPIDPREHSSLRASSDLCTITTSSSLFEGGTLKDEQRSLRWKHPHHPSRLHHPLKNRHQTID